ncbi:hypothetical protein cyc_04607 [Cyclospora cayetanensis]|uniref:Uncharacterized protein n=1 Tax=Cyclospora cayetanensis TaxID=88456 RepID=A0A1D3D4B0_9EIME|nr:hypothetical protein cyc_04607 [Cyclospora cayetanensis]
MHSRSQDLFFSFAWYGASRLLRCVRAAAWCVPPALLLKDRVFSLERTAVCPYTLAELSGEADLQTPQKQKEHQQHREDGLLSETRRGWFAAVSAPAATRAAHAAAGPEVCGHGCSPSEAASKRSFEEGRQSSWIVVLLSAGEIYRGSAPGIESKLVRRKELLLLLERLHQDNEINWQRKRGLALRQRLLQHGQQQQDKRQQPPEADSLRRSEGEHKERQGVIRQHILRLQQEAEAHPKEQQEGQHASDSSDAYLLIRVPPGRCWVETLESSPGFCRSKELPCSAALPPSTVDGAVAAGALPSAATLVEAGAAPAEASAAGSSTGSTPSDKSVTTFRSMLGGWLESLSRWLSEAAALASLPANMKPTRLPELKDISSKGTMLIIPRSEG